MTTGIYESDVLGAPDVCSNCFALVRVERVDPMTARDKFVVDGRDQVDTKSERNVRTTEVAYGPSDAPPKSKGVFCECGVESPRERIWDGDDVDRNRFKELLKNLVRTLDNKGVGLKKDEAAAYALAGYDQDGVGIDEALATAVDAGVVANINA